MTQNLTSSSLSADNADYDKQSSSEIRADIDQTRASVGDKIDQLQARLDPNRLKQQAQETVQEMLNDTAGSMTEYVKTHKDEMVTSLADAARRNPLPTALIGLGLGWLILESMAGNRPQEERRQQSSSHNYVGGYVPQGAGLATERAYYPPRSNEGYYASTDWSRSGYPAGAQNRPGFQSGQEYSQGYNQEPRQPSGNGHQQGENPLAKATGAVKDTVGDVTDRVSDTVGDVKDRVSDTVGDVTERVSNAVGDVKDRVNEAMGGMRRQAEELGQQGQRSFDRAGNQMDEWQQRARYEGQRRGQQMVNNLEDNPLIYGAVALAAGAALALLLPQSRVENRAFGEMREQVMAKGQEVFDTAKSHAQQVIEEVRPELEEKVRQIASDVSETGKQAVKDAAEQLSPIVDKAMTKGKEEARSAAQEVGIDPDKLTATKPSDTSPAGQLPSSQSASGQSLGGQSSTGRSSSGQSSSGQSSVGQASSGQSASGQASKSPSMGSTTEANRSQSKAPVLNRDTFSGQWKQIKGEVKRKWGQLTDDDMMRIEGDYDKLIGAIQTRYGYTREHVEREINDFFDSQKA